MDFVVGGERVRRGVRRGGREGLLAGEVEGEGEEVRGRVAAADEGLRGRVRRRGGGGWVDVG